MCQWGWNHETGLGEAANPSLQAVYSYFSQNKAWPNPGNVDGIKAGTQQAPNPGIAQGSSNLFPDERFSKSLLLPQTDSRDGFGCGDLKCPEGKAAGKSLNHKL